jgi:hypothetical protein
MVLQELIEVAKESDWDKQLQLESDLHYFLQQVPRSC